MRINPTLKVLAVGLAALTLASCGGPTAPKKALPGLSFAQVKNLYSVSKGSGEEVDLYVLKKTAKFEIASISMSWTKAATAAGLDGQGCNDIYYVENERWFEAAKKLDGCYSVPSRDQATKVMNNRASAIFTWNFVWPSKYKVLKADPTTVFPTTTTTLSAYEIARQSALSYARAWNNSPQGQAGSEYPTQVTIQVSTIDGTFFTLSLGSNLQQYSNYVASSDTWYGLGLGNGYNSCPGQVPLNVCEGNWFTFTFNTDGKGNIS